MTAMTMRTARSRRDAHHRARAATTALRQTLPLRAALRIGLALTGATAAIALAVALTAAEPARRLLGFGFAGVEADLGTAAEIFANNTRVLAALAAACVAVQLGRRQPGYGAAGALMAVLAAVCDGVVLVGCVMHVGLFGAAFGAYGTRTLEATIAHGPAELAAFALMLGLYVSARPRPLAARAIATTALTATALLAVAALLETFS